MAVCFPLVEYGCMFSKGLASKLSYSLEGFNESPYGHSSLAAQVQVLCSGTVRRKQVCLVLYLVLLCPRLWPNVWTQGRSHSFIQAEEKNRCLTPKITQTLWTGCAVFQAGQANAARPAISLLLTWLRHCTTLCAFLHNPDKTTEFSSTSLCLLWIQSRLSSQLLFLS